ARERLHGYLLLSSRTRLRREREIEGLTAPSVQREDTRRAHLSARDERLAHRAQHPRLPNRRHPGGEFCLSDFGRARTGVRAILSRLPRERRLDFPPRKSYDPPTP